MNIAVDCDDVLVPFHAPFYTWYDQKFGTSLAPLITDCTIPAVLGITLEEADVLVKEYIVSRAHNTVSPYDGAPETLEYAKEMLRAKIFVVSSRPPVARLATQELLGQHFPSLIDGIYCLGHFEKEGAQKPQKAVICSYEEVDCLIEDHPRHALCAQESGIRVLLYDQPWNKDVPDSKYITRVFTWDRIRFELYNIEKNKKRG